MRKANANAYHSLSKILSPKKFLVYEILHFAGPLSRFAIDELVRKEDPHYVTSRQIVNHLVNLGVIERTTKTICPVTKRQVFMFDVTGTLTVESVKRKTHTQTIRELEDRLLLAEKVLLGIQRMIPLTKNGQPLEAEIQKYRLKYPEAVVRFKTRSQLGVANDQLGKSILHGIETGTRN